MSERRFPRRVFEHGEEPDPRFTLANERTFLAWIRTSLAFTAAGVALEALAVPLHGTFRLIAAFVLIAIGFALPVQAWIGWMRTERAIRLGRPLPAPVSMLPVAIGVMLVGALVIVALVTGPGR
ncbi:YidH family protein [Glycomyces tarimensis]